MVNAQHTHTQGMRGGVGVGVGGGGVRSSRLPSFHPYGVNQMLGTIGVGTGGFGYQEGGGFKRGLGGSKGDTEGPPCLPSKPLCGATGRGEKGKVVVVVVVEGGRG